MKQISILAVHLFFFSIAKASFFTADLMSSNTDPQMGTHLIIAGHGMEVSDQWLSIAHTQALVFKDKKRHGPIKVVSGIDIPDTYSLKLKKWGYTNVVTTPEVMTDDSVIRVISKIDRIESIDMIGHNGVGAGLALQNYSNRFFLNSVQKLSVYKNKFTKNSYIRLAGCNTGWKLAPALANALDVPVSGTFSASDIQAVYSNPNEWFYHDLDRMPVGAVEIKTNSLSYSIPVNCSGGGGGCLRLKPVNGVYSGKWGTYDGNIPFQKYFCGKTDSNSCALRAATSILTNISNIGFSDKATLAQYSQAVADHMCSSRKDLSVRSICINDVKNHLSGQKQLAPGYTIMKNIKMVQCSMTSCLYKAIPTNIAIEGVNYSVELMAAIPQSTLPTTFTQELNFYKTGFLLL